MEIPREHFHAKMDTIKDRNGKKLIEEEKLKAKEKRKDIHLNAEFQKIARRDKSAFLSDQCKEMRKTIEWERLEISSRKLETPFLCFLSTKGTFHANMGTIKESNGIDLTEAEDIKKR